MSDFHKPVKRPGDVIEMMAGSGDPAELSGLAHDTAAALLNRVRKAPDQQVVDRVIAFADGEGLEDLAELWADSPASSLPGAMWRLYLLRHAVREAPSAAGYRFKRGVEVDTVGQAIAGSGERPLARGGGRPRHGDPAWCVHRRLRRRPRARGGLRTRHGSRIARTDLRQRGPAAGRRREAPPRGL